MPARNIRKHNARRRPRPRAGLLLSTCAALLLAGCAQGSVDSFERGERAPAVELLDLASELRGGQDLATAAALYRRAIAADPENPGPLIGLGDVLLQAGDALRAAGAFWEALLIAPRDRRAALGLARASLAVDLAEDAAAILEPLADDREPAIAMTYGAALDLLGRHEEAQAIYRRALKGAPRNLGLRNNLALSLAVSGQMDEAIGRMRAAAAAPEAGAPQVRNLVFVLALGGQPAAARMFAASAGIPLGQAEAIVLLAGQTAALDEDVARARLIGVFGF